MTDKGETDDKIIAILKDDGAYASWTDVYNIPQAMIDRLKHYFLTYKNIPGEEARIVEIIEVFGKAEAHEVIRPGIADYQAKFISKKPRKKRQKAEPVEQ
jgi:inorganic pyrophosphatase